MTKSMPIAFAFLTFAVSAAAAAPSSGAPAAAVRPGVAQQHPQLAMLKVDVELLPQPNKCGSPQSEKVKLTNKTGKEWVGQINFLNSGGNTVKSVTLGVNATEVVDVSTPNNLDCKKVLQIQGVRVWKANEAQSPIFVAVLKPAKVTSELHFNPPAPTETKVWLREMTFDVNCNGTSTMTAFLMTNASATTAPQDAAMQMSMGGVAKIIAASVPPMQATPAALSFAGQGVCGSGMGIVGGDYKLMNGLGAQGHIDAQAVTYAVQP